MKLLKISDYRDPDMVYLHGPHLLVTFLGTYTEFRFLRSVLNRRLPCRFKMIHDPLENLLSLAFTQHTRGRPSMRDRQTQRLSLRNPDYGEKIYQFGVRIFDTDENLRFAQDYKWVRDQLVLLKLSTY